MLGANGAGKTTILKTISGIIDPQKGSVEFAGKPIQRHGPRRIVRPGSATCPRAARCSRSCPCATICDGRLSAHATATASRATSSACYGYFPILRERRPGGRAALGRPAADAGDQPRADGRPKLMLLDEPSLGLSPLLAKEIFDIVRRINRERGMTILLVEQNANMALKTADYGYVLEVGRIVMEDTCARLSEKEDIQEFYLGTKEAGARGERRWKRKKTGDERRTGGRAWRTLATLDGRRDAAHELSCCRCSDARRYARRCARRICGIWKADHLERVGRACPRVGMGLRRARASRRATSRSMLSNTVREWLYADLGILVRRRRFERHLPDRRRRAGRISASTTRRTIVPVRRGRRAARQGAGGARRAAGA